MRAGAQAYTAYKSAEVGTLNQRDLLIKLYEGSIRFMTQARTAIYNEEWEMATTSSSKARRIFMELLSTLNFEQGAEIAEQLKSIYIFIISELTDAVVSRDPERIQKLEPVVQTLLDGWKEIPDEHANTSSLEEVPQNMINIRS